MPRQAARAQRKSSRAVEPDTAPSAVRTDTTGRKCGTVVEEPGPATEVVVVTGREVEVVAGRGGVAMTMGEGGPAVGTEVLVESGVLGGGEVVVGLDVVLEVVVVD